MFWSSTKSNPVVEVAPSTQSASDPASGVSSLSLPVPSEEKEDDRDDFVLVDSSAMQTPKAVESSKIDEVESTPSMAAPVPLSTSSSSPSRSSRTCRPYGHAHSPPALLAPVIVTAAPMAIAAVPHIATPLSSSSTSSSKRSFASVAFSAPSSTSSIIAYAEDAPRVLSIAEQVRAKIDQLTAEMMSAEEEEPQQIAAAEEEYLTTPKGGSSMRRPLNRSVAASSTATDDSQQLDPKFEWALSVEEPRSKRAKRTAASSNAPLLLSKAEQAAKLAKFKGKPQRVARKEDKEMRRARGDKEGIEISGQ